MQSTRRNASCFANKCHARQRKLNKMECSINFCQHIHQPKSMQQAIVICWIKKRNNSWCFFDISLQRMLQHMLFKQLSCNANPSNTMHATAIAVCIHVMQQHQHQKKKTWFAKKNKNKTNHGYVFFFWCDAIKRNNAMQPQLLLLSCKSNANQLKRIATQPQLLLQCLVAKMTMHDLQKKGKTKQIIVVCFIHFLFFFCLFFFDANKPQTWQHLTNPEFFFKQISKCANSQYAFQKKNGNKNEKKTNQTKTKMATKTDSQTKSLKWQLCYTCIVFK